MRLPLEGDRLERWEGMLTAKKIGQQDALHGLIDWIIEQDEMVQSIVLGQIRPSEDIIKIILVRMDARERGIDARYGPPGSRVNATGRHPDVNRAAKGS